MREFRLTGRSVWTLLAISSLLLNASRSKAGDASTDSHRLRLFETEIRPLLAEHCFQCHGPDKQNGGLRLDSHPALLHGGDSGAAIEPGNAAASLLIEAINYRSLEMPPKGKLPPEAIAKLTAWVEGGAWWPPEDSLPQVRSASAGLTAEDRAYWAFQPPQDRTPPQNLGEQGAWCRNDVDRFILAKQQEAGISPAPEADRLMLIRRVTQDLTGLPPTPDEIATFRSDTAPDAYERLVDRLLESPRYGEHLATLWLDLVRYAESDGYKQDTLRPTAWRYRDYVVQAFNRDLPYDRFVREQLAGDELDPDNPEALIATGYLRLGIYEYNQRDVRGQWRDMLNDITDNFGDVFLATSVGCARCHDHKFDAVLQQDYFRLQAFFAGLSFVDGPAATPAAREEHDRQLRIWEERTAEVRGRIDEFTRERFAKIRKSVIEKFTAELREVWDRPLAERQPGDEAIIALMQLQVDEEFHNFPRTLKGPEKEQWESLHKELTQFDDVKPAPLPEARIVGDVGLTQPVVFIPDKPRFGEISPGFLSAIQEAPAAVHSPASAPHSSGRRTALAEWLTQPDHPLTSRVIVNRVWQRMFGQGLVPTTSDFGRLGESPSHPELLDWLAIRFVQSGWSLKQLHRDLVLTATYRQTSRINDSTIAVALERNRNLDPQNRMLWHFPVRRLTGEQIRDAALAASGELDLSPGGPATDTDKSRRSVFTHVIRNRRDPLLELFDFPERLASTAERHVSTTPTQSLYLFNADWLLKRAHRLAERLQREAPGGADSRVRLAYRLTYGRDASPEELERGANFVYQSEVASPESPETVSPALVDLCHVLLNSSEFLYLD